MPREVLLVVEAVLEAEGIVVARLHDPTDSNFGMTADSTIGGAAIEPVLTIPRALHPNGTPRFDLFAFQLSDVADAARFSSGRVAKLRG